MEEGGDPHLRLDRDRVAVSPVTVREGRGNPPFSRARAGKESDLLEIRSLTNQRFG